MPPLINFLVAIFVAAYGLLILIDLIVDGERRRFHALELLGLAFVVVLFHLTTGFPQPDERIAFGGASYGQVLALVVAGVLLGMAARYFFYLRNGFKWRNFLRSFLVSPIVVLPLLGMLKSGSEWELQQVVFIFVIAFQNGFFWRAVFNDAKQVFGNERG
ncbi:MAG: hypothetical protein Tsb002_02650 [Wenzhouxiangellaceae bacterium]